MFIKITPVSGRKTVINSDHIIAISELIDELRMKNGSKTAIYMIDKFGYDCKETFEEIVKQIK